VSRLYEAAKDLHDFLGKFARAPDDDREGIEIKGDDIFAEGLTDRLNRLREALTCHADAPDKTVAWRFKKDASYALWGYQKCGPDSYQVRACEKMEGLTVDDLIEIAKAYDKLLIAAALTPALAAQAADDLAADTHPDHPAIPALRALASSAPEARAEGQSPAERNGDHNQGDDK